MPSYEMRVARILQVPIYASMARGLDPSIINENFLNDIEPKLNKKLFELLKNQSELTRY